MKPILILEAGNAHEGDINTAFKLIDEAKAAGVGIVKFQAGTPEGFARNPGEIEFYKKYALSMQNYIRLLHYGSSIGITVFFSIWGGQLSALRGLEKMHKIPARQFGSHQELDGFNTLVSYPHNLKVDPNYGYRHSIILHCVSQYPTIDPQLERISELRMGLGTPFVGFSDHTIGIDACIEASRKYGAVIIEKHFTLSHCFGPLRDHVHSATPDEVRKLIGELNKV